MTDSKDTTGSASPAPAARTFPSPFRNDLETAFDRLARGLTPFPLQEFGSWLGRGTTATPAADVVETEQGYEIRVDLPGFDEKDVTVELAGDEISLKADHSEDREEKQASYHVSERRRGSCRRIFRLPDGIDRDHIAARFDKGVLTVSLPKSAPAAGQSRKIAIGN